MENNSQIEGKPTPIEPNVIVNNDCIPDWHPTLLERSRSKRDPVLRTRNFSIQNRLQVKSSPSLKSSDINLILNDQPNNFIFDNNNENNNNNNNIMDLRNDLSHLNINNNNNNNNNIDTSDNQSSYDDMNDNSSECSTNESDSKSLVDWLNLRQKKSQSVPRNFERINLNDLSPVGSPLRNMDSKKRKDYEENDDKNWPLSPNLKNLEKQNTVWVDISCILHLPQKEASRVLGISGSLLCKRYKESTNNRKWPHRMMKKVRKEMTEPQTEENNEQKDPKLFRQLQRMKEHCMKPARIRLTRPVECHDDDYVLVNGPSKNTLILMPKSQANNSNYQISSPPSTQGDDNNGDINQMIDDSDSGIDY